ncbi:MAG: tetratricopeptide repeat protein [Chloroflexota bacterium]|nr:tetratricopeptide repeat protein [Chloroflexota bacterium]
MSYQEEEQFRLKRHSTKLAIDLAMQGKWREAVDINNTIISNFPTDVDAHNRLGRAYLELGEYTPAREAYGKALKLDPYNSIAKKNLQRMSRLEAAVVTAEADSRTAEPQSFIEEVGKAGVVKLSRLAPPEVLVKMVAGDKVYLRIEGASLVAENGRGEYLGGIQPRHALRLIKLMFGGNKYSAAVVSASEQKIIVIVRETYQHPDQVGMPSFPPRGIEDRTYVSDRMVKRGLEYEEAASEAPGYTIIDEEGVEIPVKESALEGGEEEEKSEDEE